MKKLLFMFLIAVVLGSFAFALGTEGGGGGGQELLMPSALPAFVMSGDSADICAVKPDTALVSVLFGVEQVAIEMTINERKNVLYETFINNVSVLRPQEALPLWGA